MGPVYHGGVIHRRLYLASLAQRSRSSSLSSWLVASLAPFGGRHPMDVVITDQCDLRKMPMGEAQYAAQRARRAPPKRSRCAG